MLYAVDGLPAHCDEQRLARDERCSAVALVGLPEVGPSLLRVAADKDFGVVLALFILYAE